MNGKFERAERTKSPEWLSVFTLQLIGAVLIALAPQQISVEVLEERMRKRPIPVIGRIYKGRYLLDVRTMLEEEFAVVAEALAEATNEK